MMGLSQKLCSLKYVSVDDAMRMMLELGPEMMLAKQDILRAYKIIPINQLDRNC